MKYTCTGVLKDPTIDYSSGRTIIQIESPEDFREAYGVLKDAGRLLVSMQEYKEHRSDVANRYYWKLVGLLADEIGISNPEVHNIMICRYGEPETVAGKLVFTPIPDTDEAEREVAQAVNYHLCPTSEVKEGNDGVMYRTYKLMRGSHTYNTKEMSRLIDGIISECLQAEIPYRVVATPDEKRSLKERYGIEL